MEMTHGFDLVVLELISRRRILALIAAIPLVLACIGAEVFADGNVVTSMESGYLVLTGDESANSISITQGSDGRYQIAPRNRTTINGRGTTFTAPFGIDKVSVKLNGGNDELNVYDQIFYSPITSFNVLLVEMGAGDDVVDFFGVEINNPFISGAVNLGSGNDVFNCLAVNIAAGFTINAQTGDDEVRLTGVHFDHAPNAIGGGGYDFLSLNGCTYGHAWTPRLFERVEGF
jgi:hypothetical protein